MHAQVSVRCMAGRPRKHEEEGESVPIDKGGSASQSDVASSHETAPRGMSARRRGSQAQQAQAQQQLSPWAGGGLAGVLPRMMLSPGALLSAAATDPFTLMPRGGPFGMADRLLHDLEEDIQAVLGGPAAGADVEEAGLPALMGEMERLWAAVDVKETPHEFVLSTDVPGLSKDDVKVRFAEHLRCWERVVHI